MTLTAGQKVLIKQPFSYGTSAHYQLLKEKLSAFKVQHAEMQKEVPHIFWSGVGTIAANLTGFNKLLWLIRIDYMLVFYTGMHFKEIANVNTAYRDAFGALLEIYDWCFQDPENMPPTDNPEIQTLIETMGTLVGQARLDKLKPLINGSSASSTISGYLYSGVKTLGTAALGVFSSAPAQNIMEPATFAAKVRGYVNGETTSWWNFYIFGEGSHLMNKALSLIGKGQQATQSAIDAAQVLAPQFQALAKATDGTSAHLKPE